MVVVSANDKAKYTSENKSVSTVYDEVKKGMLFKSLGIQRRYRWNEKQKSLFIKTCIKHNIPAHVLVLTDENGDLQLIDGLQRISTVEEYLDNQFVISENILINYSIKGGDIVENYNLKGKRFKELPKELKNCIKKYVIGFDTYLEPLTDEDIAEIFEGINNGSPITYDEGLRIIIFRKSSELLSSFDEAVDENDCILRKIISKKSRNTGGYIGNCIRALILLDDTMKNSLSSKNSINYIKSKLTLEDVELVKDALAALDKYTDSSLTYTRLNAGVVAQVIACAIKAYKNGTIEMYAKNLETFFSKDNKTVLDEMYSSTNNGTSGGSAVERRMRYISQLVDKKYKVVKTK